MATVSNVTNRDIAASASDPITANKLENVYKLTNDFGFPVSGESLTWQIGTRAKVGGTAGWVVAAADNLPYIATLPASQTGSTLILPVDGLEVGDVITAFTVNAQIESAGGAVTLDGDLRAVTNVAAEPTDASVGTITQISVSADTAASQEKSSLTYTVAAGVSVYLKLTGTTAASTDIIALHPTITVQRTRGLTTKTVVLFVADAPGSIEQVGAGLYTDGSSTSITFDVLKATSTSVLSSVITVTSSTGDRTETAGSLNSANASYVAGDVIIATMTVSSAVGAVGPWVRLVCLEDGI